MPHQLLILTCPPFSGALSTHPAFSSPLRRPAQNWSGRQARRTQRRSCSRRRLWWTPAWSAGRSCWRPATVCPTAPCAPTPSGPWSPHPGTEGRTEEKMEGIRLDAHQASRYTWHEQPHSALLCGTWWGKLRVSDSLLIWPRVLRSSSRRLIIFWMLSLLVAWVEPEKGMEHRWASTVTLILGDQRRFWGKRWFIGNLTFHHLHLLQRELPQELVFTGGVNHTGSRVAGGKVLDMRVTGVSVCVCWWWGVQQGQQGQCDLWGMKILCDCYLQAHGAAS